MHQQQRILDFESLSSPERGQPVATEGQQLAQETSLPPPDPARSPSRTVPLVRPERQITYDELPCDQWPPPERSADRITVDRIHADIDGPPHRFVVEIGDRVDVHLGTGEFATGTATEINHHNQEVCVVTRSDGGGLWHRKESLYPASEWDDLPTPETDSTVIPSVNTPSCRADGEDFHSHSSPRTVPRKERPYNFDDFKSFAKSFDAGSLSYSEYRQQFEDLITSPDTMQAELKSRFNARELATLALRFGVFHAPRSTKSQNAAAVFERMVGSFLLDGTVSYQMGERYVDAVANKVRSVTADEFSAALAKRQAAKREQNKALTNPETFYEFRQFLRERSEEDLSDEQLARYDALHAEVTRERRAAEVKTSVDKSQHEQLAGNTFQLKEGFHDKRNCPLWIVQLTERVERSAFRELNLKAKQLGGWYSSFKKSDAGFQFLDRSQADRFCGLLRGAVDRQDVLQARAAHQEISAAERLHILATDLARRADEAILRSSNSLQNTARRADIQAGVRGRAYADLSLSRTLHSIAEALSCGKAIYLAGIHHKTQVETLEVLLRRANWASSRALPRHPGTKQEPMGPADVRYAEYPYPTIYKRHLDEFIVRCQSTKGLKQSSERIRKRLTREQSDYLRLRAQHDIEAVEALLARAKASGLDVERLESSFHAYRRLQRANIGDLFELRSALREYVGHRAETRGDDSIKVAERELIGRKLPGFFPTPAPIIERMLDLADIALHHIVLEPSCGKGDILDAIRTRYPSVGLHAVELNQTLADVLAAKGHVVELSDFLDHRGEYDRIVMNPPFEGGADTVHVRHAYSLLKPGGRLVAVLSEGAFFRTDKKAASFRQWLETTGAASEQLPSDAFAGGAAFRATNVRTRLVVINRPAATPSQ